jgi:imidazolonepropionase-like amidohydrolase
MVLVEPAAQHIQMTTLGRRYPGSLMGTLALVRQSLLDARHRAEEGAAYARSPRGRKRPRHDERLAAWHEVVAGRIPLVVGASRENDVRRAVALADEFAIRVIVAGTPMAHRVTDIVRSRRLPLLLSVNFDPPRPLTFGFFRGTDEEKEKREIEEAEASPARLHEAGIPFALVSGHAKDFLAGVRKAIERGLPREAALRAVTLGAAEVLGIADRLGTLEIGKIANLVAWSGDPLTKQAKVKMVFVDGQLHEPEERPEGEKREPKGGVPGQ